jgi:hypothetical protein
MSDQHAMNYYASGGSETAENSGPIETWDAVETAPAALSDTPADFATPQPGLNAPIGRDKSRGSS